MVIQGHRCRYQSKVDMLLPISDLLRLRHYEQISIKNRRFQHGQFVQKFQVEGVAPRQPFLLLEN